MDLEHARLATRRAITRRDRRDLERDDAKTGASRRIISLSPAMADELRRHRERQEEVHALAGDRWREHRLVFTTSIGTPVHERSLDRRHYKPALARAGLRPGRLYDLRHTCATMLLVQGGYPKGVAELLGHRSIETTLDTYSRVLPYVLEAVTEVIDGAFFGERTPFRTP